jgi:tetratricopeptide (TPR) repeat protein
MFSSLFKRRTHQPAQETAVEASPAALDDAQIDVRLAEAKDAYDAGDHERCRSMLERLMQSNPHHSAVRTKLGVFYCQVQEPARAKEVLLPLVQEDPKNTEALRFLAASFFNLGEFVPALGVIEAVRKLRPSDHELATVAGDIYADHGYMEQAASEYIRASDLLPESTGPLLHLEWLSQKCELRVGVFDGSHPRITQRRRRAIRRLLVKYRKTGLDDSDMATLLALMSGSPDLFSQAYSLAMIVSEKESNPYEIERFVARILLTQGDLKRALLVAERVSQQYPDLFDPKFMLGRLWLCAGNDSWSAGWRLMSEVVTMSRHYHHSHGVPIWEGQKLGNRRLLVYQDQGVGDAIMCFRLLPLLAQRGIDYRVWVQPALAGLAGRAPDCPLLEAGDTKFVPGPEVHRCDYAISMFGLIAALYLQPEELEEPPVVRPDPEHAQVLRQKIRALPGMRVGLLYGGNPDRRDDWVRSVPVALLKTLQDIAGISWVNLMVDKRADREQVNEMFSMSDPMPEVKDFHDTAAVVEELDAVVAVDASVAHVAGNLRKPLWVLAPTLLDFRWQMGDRMSPWWPTARVLRSESPGEWRSCIDQLHRELREFVGRRRQADAGVGDPERKAVAADLPT